MYLDKLVKQRAVLIAIIAKSADNIAKIDHMMGVIKSQGLEADLIQAEPCDVCNPKIKEMI